MSRGSCPNGVVPLEQLEILVVVDNETDTLSSVDEGVPQVPEVIHLAARTPPDRQYKGHDCKTVFHQLCCCCHGLSVLITGRRGGQQRCMLFDTGPDSRIWLDNARRLDIDLSTIECVFLSHWHFDHSGAFPEVIAAISAARAAAGLSRPVIDLHPNRPDQRGILLPSGVILLQPPEATLDALAQAGGEVLTRDNPHPICDGFFYGSGAIDRVTEYEKGFASHVTFRGNVCEPDPLIMDERFVAAYIPDRGVTVFSACSHAGIINVCLQAKADFANAPIDLALGGYHLAGKEMEPRIGPTVRDLKDRIEPRLVAPGHCTGWRAKAKLADTFAPGRYAPSVVGTVYKFGSGPI